MISIPDPEACKRLAEIADAIQPGFDAAQQGLDKLLVEINHDFTKKQAAVQDGYWNNVVAPHLAEIAALTNNSTTTLASVFRPKNDVIGLGGVTPDVLRRLASGTGSWRN
jgi:hypothetical protein